MQAAQQILDETFLETRAKLLEVAATLDRIDRAADNGEALDAIGDSQRGRINDAIRLLLSEGPDRAERLQRLFSREYQSAWRQEMNL